MAALFRSLFAIRNFAVLLLAGASLAACATPHSRYATRQPQADPGRHSTPAAKGGGVYKVGKPYQVGGIWYVPREDPRYDVKGVASWYGDQFHMKKTANGEIFDKNALSAAHPTLPLPSIVEVTNLENGRSLRVRVNDRGPFVGGRVIDMSHAAAEKLGFDRKGLAKVRVRYVGPAPLGGRAAASPESRAPIAPPPIVQARAPAASLETSNTDVGWPSLVEPTLAQTATAPVVRHGLPPVNPPDPVVFRLASESQSMQSGYRIQAGAFSDLVNARRAAATLARGGAPAVIERVDRNGATLFRVVVPTGEDENAALALRDAVAGYGFANAQVLRAF